MRAKVSMLASPLPDTAVVPPSESEKQPELVYGETATRSFVKALVWRLTAAVVTLVRKKEIARGSATNTEYHRTG